MKRLHKNIFQNQAAAYLFFGAATTVVNWIIYTALSFASPFSISLCNLIAWLAAVLFAYVTNRIFVFHSDRHGLFSLFREFFLFIGSRIFTGLFEIFLPSLLFRLGLDWSFLGIRGFYAKAAVTVLVILLNYILSRHLVFRKQQISD